MDLIKTNVDVFRTYSNLSTILLVTGIFSLFIAMILFNRRKLHVELPGPTKWPVIGNALWVTKSVASSERLPRLLYKESKKYGDIVTIQIGDRLQVILHGLDAIHEAFVKKSDVVSSRPYWLPNTKIMADVSKGIILESGQQWKLLRRFSLQSLRDFGVGKSTLEDKIMLEVDAASDYFINSNGKPTDVRKLTSMMITNVIYGIVFAERYEYDDSELHTIIHNLDVLFGVGGLIDGLGNLPLPVLRLLNKDIYNNRIQRDELFDWLKRHIDDEISSHEETFDPENIRDFVDIYFQSQQGGNERNKFTKTDIFGVIYNFLLAGAETTSNTLNWSLLYMIEHPNIQRRCQEEINNICGDRVVTMADRNKLVFVEATLLEIQRLSNIAEMTLPHTNDEDIFIQGHRIPKHSIINGNLYSVHMDPKYWDKPDAFRPERFIENGKIKKHAAFMPFGIGPRMCMGETLAKMELFLMVSNLLQRFSFFRENEDNRHSFDAKLDQVTSAPVPYKLKCERRN